MVVHHLKKIRMGRGGLEGINGYTYLKHIVEMWPGVWEGGFGIVNEVVVREMNLN